MKRDLFHDQPFQSIPKIRCRIFTLKSRAKTNLFGEFPKKTFNPNTGVDKKTSTCKKLYSPSLRASHCQRYRHEHAMSAEYGTKVFLGDVATKVPRAPPRCDAKRLSRAHRPLTGLPTAGLPLGRCLTYNKPGHGAPSVPPKANSNPTAVLLRTSVHSCVRA